MRKEIEHGCTHQKSKKGKVSMWREMKGKLGCGAVYGYCDAICAGNGNCQEMEMGKAYVSVCFNLQSCDS
ncbi:hypothetical protein NC653_031103 [Populus alba x Populus x berolinensis]|uniref:Uncharacterized protein n=1 Tax=Populus alba x Populus x berolinensis TaxID=444605 RepID=A0AAD6M0F5_9ROSI|nr:hypothetical protein NC653_031103 [Populus alba x Populus x berolinensis]